LSRSILVLNAGSSSLKFQVFTRESPRLPMLLAGQIEGIGRQPHLVIRDPSGAVHADTALAHDTCPDFEHCLHYLLDTLSHSLAHTEIIAAGHRVVHGGIEFRAPVRVDEKVLTALDALVPLAPLHQPHNLAAIRALRSTRPSLPQVACFDTSFHRTQPIEAELYALPRQYYDEGVRRYGFHGLSYEYVASRLPSILSDDTERVVVAHLGNGASLCALDRGRSVATSMGFTALEGLPMGTRSGSLDPGLLLYLLRDRGMSIDALEDILYRQSGLLGVSGVSSDMRELLDDHGPNARTAVDYFTYRVAREIASCAAALEGIDALVFTAGIGENSAAIRSRICERLCWLGVLLDPAANAVHGPLISTPASRVSAWVVRTNEERVIAQHTLALLEASTAEAN
jgi:acetate kinase